VLKLLCNIYDTSQLLIHDQHAMGMEEKVMQMNAQVANLVSELER
jgi:hypothetical protein